MRMKKKTFRGKYYYLPLISIAVLLLLLLFVSYVICSFSLRQASRQTQAVLETMLTLQVEEMGESHAGSEKEENIYGLADNETLLALSLEEELEEGDALDEARAILESFEADSSGEADETQKYFLYLSGSGTLLGTGTAVQDGLEWVFDVFPGYITQLDEMDDGMSRQYLSMTEDGEYYSIRLVRLTPSLALVRVSVGRPSYSLSELFTKSMTGVEMYTYDQFGNSHILEENQVLKDVFDYASFDSLDSTFTFTYEGHRYIGSYYNISSRSIHIAIFCRDTAAEYQRLLSVILAVCMVIFCVIGIGLTMLIVGRAYRPLGALVSRVTDGKEKGTELLRDEYQLISQQLNALDRQLQEQKKILQGKGEQMAETVREPLPENQDFYELTESIRLMDREQISSRLTEILNQIEVLPENDTELKELLFSLLVHSVALAVLEIDWPGDISRQMVRLHAENVHSAAAPKALETAISGMCDAFDTWQNPKKEEFLRFQEIKKYLSENYSDPNLTAKLVADRFSVSKSGLTRLFRRYNQTGFLEWVHQLRLEEATRLLKETDKTRAEIAKAVGYTTVSTMDRDFRTYVGMTPGKVREASRQQRAEEEEQE